MMEPSAFFVKVQRAGWAVGYDPSVRVRHAPRLALRLELREDLRVPAVPSAAIASACASGQRVELGGRRDAHTPPA